MNNEQLIMNIAIAHGLYTPEEAQKVIAEEGELPLHSLLGWKKRSPAGFEYRIKKGEHGIETRLWKRKTGKQIEEGEPKDEVEKEEEPTRRYYYLAKTYLFAEGQVELVKNNS